MTVGYLDPADNTVKQVMTADDVVASNATILAAITALGSTATPAPVYGVGQKYKICPASQTTNLSASGATGDRLDLLILQPTTLSPGSVVLKDGTTTVLTFPGGPNSVGGYQPINLAINIAAVGAGFSLVIGSGISALAIGSWT